MSLLEEALACAERAWYIHPVHGVINGICTCKSAECAHPGKHPAIPRWTKPVLRSTGEIEHMFGGESVSNLGILTGAESGLVVLDVDPQHGGSESLAALEKRYGRLPVTPTVLTGGGGQHLYFAHPGGRVKTTRSQFGAGIDVRADGGQVVGPGSVHLSGCEYAWQLGLHPNEMRPAELPTSWLNLLRSRKLSDVTANAPLPTWDPLAVLDGVPEGRRHDEIFLMCSSMRRQAVPPHVVEQLALHAAAKCRPPLPPEEARRIARDVVDRYPPNGGRAGRGPSPERLAVMRCVVSTVGPASPTAVAKLLGCPKERVKKMMQRMTDSYGELVRVRGGYLLAGTKR